MWCYINILLQIFHIQNYFTIYKKPYYDIKIHLETNIKLYNKLKNKNLLYKKIKFKYIYLS